jgi:hypothetical protein
LSDTYRRHGRLNVLHRIVDRQSRSHASAGTIDVEIDVLRRIVGLEKEELSNDGGGGGLFDFAIEGDDAFLQQAREDVLCVPAASLCC